MKSLQHYIDALKSRGATYINQRRGWKTYRKIVVIESDDWGSIRMPSRDTLNLLLSKGVKLNPELGYDKYDTLASNSDLEMLFDVLDSVKDKNGNPAKITFNTIMTNPNFDKIKESGYTEYYYELFIDTLKRYPNHDRSFLLWKEGMANNFMKPQFHAREHLNVQLWLRALRESWEGARTSFEENVFCNYFNDSLDKRSRFLETYNIVENNEYGFILKSLVDGLRLFEKTFGFKSKSMIAPNYIWDEKIEEKAFKNGVKYLQGSSIRRNTMVNKNNGNKSMYGRYMGQINKYKQISLIRNCLFEPSQDKTLDAYYCLKGIETMFKYKKPAIICSHRLNYIGELDYNNRNNSLKDLSFLLKTIVNKHPDVEFMFSDELGNVINQNIGI